jgi:hypothetical protein
MVERFALLDIVERFEPDIVERFGVRIIVER